MSDRRQKRTRTWRLYSHSEKQTLIRKLISIKDQLTWTSVYNDNAVAGKIPSRRTLYRIFDDPKGCSIRDQTAHQVENLLLLLENAEAEAAPKAALMRDIYSALRPLLGVSREENEAFLDRFEGTYKCIRLTTRSREILVTYLEISRSPGNVPQFKHIEIIPHEAKPLSADIKQTIQHDGYVFASNRRAQFISPQNGMRQMSCVISANKDHPTFSGILLTTDMIQDFPFAARVFITKTDGLSVDGLKLNNEFGLFSPNDKQYSSYLPVVTNKLKRHSVLFPDTNI